MFEYMVAAIIFIGILETDVNVLLQCLNIFF